MKDVDQAWEEGYLAYEQYKGLGDNPYEEDEDEHLSWNDGYLAAEYEYLTNN